MMMMMMIERMDATLTGEDDEARVAHGHDRGDDERLVAHLGDEDHRQRVDERGLESTLLRGGGGPRHRSLGFLRFLCVRDFAWCFFLWVFLLWRVRGRFGKRRGICVCGLCVGE